MHRNQLILILAAGLVLALVAPSAAQIKPQIAADLGVHSKYVWRGVAVNDGPVRQGSVSASLAGASIGIWANEDLDDTNTRSGDFTEVDSWVAYGLGVGLVGLDAGLLHYGYPDATGDTSEIYLSGSVSVLFTPCLTVYRDLDAVDGTYVNLGVSQGVPLGGAQTLDLDSSVGVGTQKNNQAYYAGADGGASDFAASASWTWEPVTKLAITPKVTWATLLGQTSDAVAAADGNTSALVGSVVASVSF
jgi:uncharacterized protein (TIGR02001 family)